MPLRVLYVEDDRICALLMTHLVATEPGVELRVAETGAEALATLRGGWAPDLLVLDAHLPDTTGHDLLGQLRASAALQQVPACMCSADNEPAHRQRATQAGFDHYWPKPLPVSAIRAMLQALKAKAR